MRHAVTITWDDIDTGRAWRGDCCPISLAIRRLWPGAADIRVGSRTVDVDSRTYSLSTRLQGFRADFDADRPVRPFASYIEG